MIRSLFVAFVLFASFVHAQDQSTRIENYLRPYVENRGFTGAIIVAENGAIVYSKGLGLADRARNLPNGPQVHYRIASITKTFTASMVIKLVEQGRIKLQDPITTYLTNYRRDTGDKVTIHHLLTHSSGIPNYTNSTAWTANAKEPMPSVDYLIQTYCSDSLEFEPGSRYKYSNSGYILLGGIIQKVTGKTYEQALQELILKPAGMNETGLDCSGLEIPARAEGYVPGFSDARALVDPWNIDWAYAAGGLYSTPEDMVKWDQILYDNTFITRPFVRLMSTPYFETSRPEFKYGYGFTLSRRVVTRDEDTMLVMMHGGDLPGFSSLFSRVPATRQVVFLVSNVSSAPLQEITDGIFSILNGLPPAPVKKSLAWTLYRAINAKGAAAGLRDVESERYAKPDEFEISEGELNILGYEYMNAKKFSEAEAVFGVNVREFPKSWNVYDSMGECYALSGDKEKAVAFYKKSVEMNPKNAGGIEALKKLEAPPTE